MCLFWNKRTRPTAFLPSIPGLVVDKTQWAPSEDYLVSDVVELHRMPDKVHCSHILLKSEKEAKALMERLNKGEKFANLAKQSSVCPSAKRGGDLGTFTRGKMVKEFETAAFALQKGQTSQIVKTKFGYHIIKRLE